MKILKLSLLTSATLLLVNCGGGSSSGSTPTLTKIETVEEAQSNFKALTALGSLNSDVNEKSSKFSKVLSLKTTSGNCDSGTISVTETATESTIVASACTVGSIYMDGTISEVELTGGTSKFTMSNLTIKNDGTELKTSSFVIVENESEYWSTIDGDMNIVSKCFSGNYDFKTVSKIYDAQDGSDNAESGILELNGARYTFSNPYVTIKVGSEEETIFQSELEKRMNNSSTCSE